MTEEVPVTKEDFLDEDKPIRGQNYVCLSFISPEDILIQKDVYFFNKFLGSFSKNMEELIASLKAKYPNENETLELVKENYSYIFNVNELNEQYNFFKGNNSEDLEKEFHTLQEYRPTIRGIKVRGTFDTLKEAQVRAEVLKRMGDKFDIFIGQVGCWCPWSPNPNDLENQEYAETQLNTLMKKYKENTVNKEAEFGSRKAEKMERIKQENERRKAEVEELEKSTENLVVEENA